MLTLVNVGLYLVFSLSGRLKISPNFVIGFFFLYSSVLQCFWSYQKIFTLRSFWYFLLF